LPELHGTPLDFPVMILMLMTGMEHGFVYSPILLSFFPLERHMTLTRLFAFRGVSFSSLRAFKN
jgi:hypothetical protein